MKQTCLFALTILCLQTCFAEEPVSREFVAAVYRGNSTHVIVGNTAVSSEGAIVRAGDTYLTPHGAYVKVGNSFLKPGGGAVVSADGSYVGTGSALVKANSGADLILIGSEGASVGAGSTILRPLLISP
jgi:hypothetical protein